MVVKERIVVDLLFNEVNTCVKTVKEWFVSKGYKKITSRNPDRWSASVTLDIARGGLMSKTTVQAQFKSHGGGNSIMIEFLGSNDGSGLSGKPGSAAPDPKDKPYEALAMDLSRFVKSTWKRGSGPGQAETPAAQQTTMYQTSTPSYRSPLLSGSQQTQEQTYPSYDSQQQYGYQEQAQTGYDASAGYTQEAQQTYQETQQAPQEPVYQEPQPVVEAPAPTPEPVAAPTTEGGISDEEAARLEAELSQQEVDPRVDGSPQVRVGPVPEEELPTPKPITFDTPQITTPVVESPIVSEPPVPSPPEPDVPAPPQAEIPVPEPVAPEPVVEPTVEPAPVIPEPVTPPVVEPAPAPVAPAAAPTEAVCPGCGKKTKPKWKTCPYCEYDLSGTKSAPPAEASPAAEPQAQPVIEAAPQQVEQPAVTVVQQIQTAGNVEATCPTCPTCGQPPTWIADYNRYYCYSCQQYM